MLDNAGSLHLRLLRMLQKGIRLCSEASWWEECGMDFSSVMPEDKSFCAAAAEVSLGMGTCFGSVITLLSVQICENPEFHDFLIQRDKSDWPRCFLWHGWLLAISGSGRVASHLLESSLGVFSYRVLEDLGPPEDFAAGFRGGPLAVHPDDWTDVRVVCWSCCCTYVGDEFGCVFCSCAR